MAGIPEIRPINPAKNVPKRYFPSLEQIQVQYIGQYQRYNPNQNNPITPPLQTE
jgi:hypothetical protein